MSRAWTTWTPTIGRRVRVRGNPECFYCRATWEREDGQTGTVVKIGGPPEVSEPGAGEHVYWIEWDDGTDPRILQDGIWSHFAAAELEPL